MVAPAEFSPATVAEHPLRQTLSDEIHARPPVPLAAPARVAYLAFLHGEKSREQESAHLARLGAQLGRPLEPGAAHHLIADCGRFQLKWERHNEFSSYTFFAKGDPATGTALADVADDWLAAIPGQLIAATHVELHAAGDDDPQEYLAKLSAPGEVIVASQIAGENAWVFTDFRIRDGFSRFVIIDDGLGVLRAGRTVQRVLEVEIYRVMALLAFPVAKEVGRLLNRAEAELAELIDRMGAAASAADEHALLADLTRLAGEVEHSVARTAFRFGASAAYYRLVQQRVAELKETRIPGLPTIKGFMERRLAPALNTCDTIARRQEDLSARIARTSQLLRTRVDIELERQNQELLTQMNHRARLQLRLQETVEGLSVVAITYYGSQLVQYLAKGAKGIAPWLSPEVATAVAIPLIALFVAGGLARMRKQLAREERSRP